MRGQQNERSQRPLTLEEVKAAGLPAIFSLFGDHLAYVDGTIYCLPRELQPCEVGDLRNLPSAYRITTQVGIEYGWYQLESCATDDVTAAEAA